MVRFTIEGTPITVAYGYDEGLSDYFLSVYDKRLEIKDDGGGSYFDLHTGKIGFGMRVSIETIRVYLARYGVPKKKIQELFSGKYSEKNQKLQENQKEFSIPKSGIICNKSGCNQDWINHKLICDALPYPVKSQSQQSVYGIYLPEDNDKPIFVSVSFKMVYDKEDNTHYQRLDKESFLGKDAFTSSSVMARNPLNPQRVMQNMLVISYRDHFLKDGKSKTNKTVYNMTKGKLLHDWRGPILVTKAEGLNIIDFHNYIDIDSSDFSDLFDFFLSYG
ncbi:unnamed protein product [Brachionus calyciflorus]|uniref:Uncharacterized protein n=1 Tax=Brachionus calyciflorus TaxID=104777 RepID=A0A814RVF9_9BILA|nr:unnamed protein product [Brachionus calyciflorus]